MIFLKASHGGLAPLTCNRMFMGQGSERTFCWSIAIYMVPAPCAFYCTSALMKSAAVQALVTRSRKGISSVSMVSVGLW